MSLAIVVPAILQLGFEYVRDVGNILHNLQAQFALLLGLDSDLRIFLNCFHAYVGASEGSIHIVFFGWLVTEWLP